METVGKIIKKLEETGTGFEKLEIFRNVEASVGASCLPSHLVEICDKYEWVGTKEKILQFVKTLPSEKPESVSAPKKTLTPKEKEALDVKDKKEFAEAAAKIMEAKKEV